MTTTPADGGRRGQAWPVVAAQELRDLWLGGRGLILSFAFSVLLSVTSYMVATNQALNFLEQRESVNLTLQTAVAIGSLLVLLAAADAISGERERSTLEALLLTPVSRLGIVGGKLLSSLSLWFAAFVISIPYVWFLARGIDLTAEALASGFVVGSCIAIFMASLGMIVSLLASSNRVSLSVSLFVLLALFVPTQLPSSALRGWAGELFLRINPVTAGEHYIGRLIVNGRGVGDDIWWLTSPVVAAVVLPVVVGLIGRTSIRLGRGGDG